MGKKADTQNRYIQDISTTDQPLSSNIGLIGYSNGGNASLVAAGLHGNDLNGLSWLINWESPVGDGMATAEAGAGGGNTTNPEKNPAYNADTGVFDLTGLKYDDSISVNQHHGSPIPGEILGGLYFDINNNHTFDEGTDFMPFPMMVEETDGVKAYYSVRLTKEAYDQNYFPSTPPSHIATLEETETYLYYRNGEYWFTDIVNYHPNLMFMIVASDQDHVQTAEDHPHVLIQYDGLLSAGINFTRLNPDASYVDQVLGATSNAVDNDAFYTFDHLTIRNAVEPSGDNGIGTKNLITAAACEMADRVNTDNVGIQIEPSSNDSTTTDDESGNGSSGRTCFLSTLLP